MRTSQFKGYLLEDVVAYLLKQNGFELLRQSTIDNFEDEFFYSSNEYNIRGRGGSHQFDTLGNFKWNIPFVNPIRLFVEAKFNKKPVGINIVRNGIALINDVNQNLFTMSMDNHKLSLPKYNYQYAIFSASGFTSEAIRMALAHNIVLVDLSGSNYNFLLNRIEEFIDSLNSFNSNEGNKTDYINISDDHIGSKIGKHMRNQLRNILFESTDYLYSESENVFENSNLHSCIMNFADNFIRTEESLYLANTGGAYTLVMSTNDNENFVNSMRRKPNQKVEITWNDNESRDTWIVTNIITARDNEIPAFQLKFTLPGILSKYIFLENEHNYQRVAADTKGTHFNNINIVISTNDLENSQDDIIMCSLRYDATQTENIINETYLL